MPKSATGFRSQAVEAAVISRQPASAPRICFIGPIRGADDERLRSIARLHFDWMGCASGVASKIDFSALEKLRERADRHGLRLLADLDPGEPGTIPKNLGDRVSRLGRLVHGIRALGAHRHSPELWRDLMRAAPEAIWIADTLGASELETARVLTAGFAYYLSSVKWWDTRQSWSLDQQERLRGAARSIGFPENLGGARLRTELAGTGATELAGLYRVRYALAAFFGAGVMMPFGYEHAAVAALEDETGASASPDAIDLRAAITGINRIKASFRELDFELSQRPLAGLDGLALVKLDDAGAAIGCFLCNVLAQGISVSLDEPAKRGGLDITALRDVTPAASPRIIGRRFWLAPYEWRLFMRPAAFEPEAQATYREEDRRIAGSGRVVIEGVEPEIDGGRFPIKRVVGDRLQVGADIYRDGHEVCAASLLVRADDDRHWAAEAMLPHENDRWFASIELTRIGLHCYGIEAWRDVYASWLNAVAAKYDAGQEIAVELVEGQALVAAAAQQASGRARCILLEAAEPPPPEMPIGRRFDRLCAAEVRWAMAIWGARADLTRYPRELQATVDRKAARFSAWYEMFPRSQGNRLGRSATFADCTARLDDVAAMGFSVVYLPPIHPIGAVNRKGRNNALAAGRGDPGSPYAIGSIEGGHDAIEPGLGTLEDFRDFVAACRRRGMEVALDFAVQCAPDHPWIAEHPEWFEFRPDGSIRFAENPPKKYQDIVNVNLRGDGPIELWHALRDIVLFWVEQGVAIFRVDNPHTKPFPFWAWLIREVQRQRPQVIFLAEAFTRPKPLLHLAKLGFTQSYTYFTWRNGKQELTDYFSELTQTEAREYLRPHLFTNTPDILPKFLQEGGPAAFRIRAVLAATLSSLFGIYNGFELCEARALPNSEEYLDSEKYQYKVWDWDRPGNIKAYIAALNRVRATKPALQDWRNLSFLPCDSDRALFFAKWGAADTDHVFATISLDPRAAQTVNLQLPLDRLGLAAQAEFAVESLLGGGRRPWIGSRQRVSLTPEEPAFLFSLAASPANRG